jgi:sugar lactone lactonase YvrE
LVQPVGVALDSGGRLFVADAGVNCIYLVSPGSGALLLLAGTHDEHGSSLWRDDDGAHARFARPCALAAGPDGALYVADFGNHCIRRVAVPPPGSEADPPPPVFRGRRHHRHRGGQRGGARE